MKNLWKLMCLAGGATLFGMGCGAPPEETTAETSPVPEGGGKVRQPAVYQICWPALGV